MVCVAPRPVSECERIDDTDALAASDVTCTLLDLRVTLRILLPC